MDAGVPVSRPGPAGIEFDAAPPPAPDGCCARIAAQCPAAKAICTARGLCFRHERSWGKNRSEPVGAFIARTRPLQRAPGCQVAGCDRESVTGRGLCRFHDQRLLRRHAVTALTGQQLADWIAGERPRLGVHQFSLAGLPELLQAELLFALQLRDHAAPPLDPTEIRILLARLDGTASLREADPQVRLRIRRDAVQHRDPRTVPRPAAAPGPGLDPVLRR